MKREAMKPQRRNVTVIVFLILPLVAFAAAARQTLPRKDTSEKSGSSAFEPLDRWKAAVVSGDRTALAALYTISPPAQAKIPQGQTQDPAEEPGYWSSLRGAGLSHLEVKILEIKDLQPGVKGIVLRFEVDLRTPEGVKSGIISGSQIWLEQVGEWRIVQTQRGDLVA